MSLNVSHEKSSLVNGDHSLLVFSRLQFSLRELFWQFHLRGPRLRTIIHDVFVSYLKNWQWSQIAPIIHISCFCNSCIFKASHDCISVFASRSDSWHQALQSILLWRSYTCTWLHLGNSLSSYPQIMLLFCHNIVLRKAEASALRKACNVYNKSINCNMYRNLK